MVFILKAFKVGTNKRNYKFEQEENEDSSVDTEDKK